jgi:hypothetical protein
LSLTLFEKTPLIQLFDNNAVTPQESGNPMPLNLFT